MTIIFRRKLGVCVHCWFYLLILQSFDGSQLSIWNCCEPFSSVLYVSSCVSGDLFLSIVVEVFRRLFFPDIAPSRMFTTNSLCLIVCCIQRWRLFFESFKSNLSSSVLWKTSSYFILFVHFIFNILLQHHVSNALTTVSSFFPKAHISDPKRATLQIQIL